LVLAWVQTHDLIEENADLLVLAAERLYQDGVLGWETWENFLLTPFK
jgi:hypothetical protein